MTATPVQQNPVLGATIGHNDPRYSAQRIGVTRRFDAKALWVAAATLCVAVLTLLTGSHLTQAIAYMAVALCMIPIAIVAVQQFRIDAALAVGLTMIGVLNAGAAVLRVIGEDHERVLIWADVIGLLSGVILIAVVGVIARNRRSRDFRSIFADAGIVALGSWVLSWVIIIRPTLDRHGADHALTVMRSEFQPIGAIVVFLLIVIVFSDKELTPAVALSATAIVVALGGGFLRGLHDSGRVGDFAGLGIAAETVGIGLLLAAIVHPSLKTLTTRVPDEPERPIVARLLVTTAALVVPIIVIASTSPHDNFDRGVRTVSVAILSLLVTVRTIQAIGSGRAAQEALMRSAHSDSLTGLPNRDRLLQVINATLSESWKGEEHPTLFFIDVDRFKHINDSLGHAAGDEVLCSLADRLRESVPERATVARISGDEYVVLDPASPSLAHAMDLANHLLNEFREPLTIAAPECDIVVTASIGIARLAPQSHRDADVLLRRADTAMYQAKDAGRNCVALFDEDKNERASYRLSVESALFRALDRDELRLHYQPILEMATGEVIGFEALMRWQQADGTIVPPVEFIPIAEETGVIVRIGAWALLEAMTQLRTWIDDGICSPKANMSVNVSPRQLADPTFSIVVNDAMTQSRVSPSLLWLEVTEGIMISEPDVALATLRRLRSLGVRVAIDDFGTGYSSLSSLQQFPLQRIKIDRAFVQGVADNSNDRALVRTIIAMGFSLGLDMVAEGVETLDQLRVLSELGCTKAQGYLISRPIPPEAMRSTVAALERMGGWPGIAGVAELSDVNA